MTTEVSCQGRARAWFCVGLAVWALGAPAFAQEPLAIKPQALLEWQSEQIRALAFTSDGKTLVVAPKDPDCWLVDPETGKKRGDLKSLQGPTTALFAGPRPELVYCVESIVVRLANLETGKDVATYGTSVGKPTQGFLSPKGDLLVTASAGVEFIEAKLGSSLETLVFPDPPASKSDFVCSAAAYSSDGKFAAGGKPNGKLYLWSLDGLKSTGVKTLAEAHPGAAIDGLAFAPSGLISVGRDGRLRWWSNTGQELATHSLGGPLERAWLLAEGRLAAVIPKPHDGALQLYRLSAKPEEPPVLAAKVSFVALFDGFPTVHREFAVTALALSPRYDRLAVAAQAGAVGLTVAKAGVYDVSAVAPKPPALAPLATGPGPPGKAKGQPSGSTAEPAEFRTWTSADGKFTVEARLVGQAGTSLRLERKDSGKVITVPLRQFSAADQAYVRGRK